MNLCRTPVNHTPLFSQGIMTLLQKSTILTRCSQMEVDFIYSNQMLVALASWAFYNNAQLLHQTKMSLTKPVLALKIIMTSPHGKCFLKTTLYKLQNYVIFINFILLK